MTPTFHRRDRGQTGVDFIVGVGIFLLTVGFVVAFVPGMLSPFGEDAGHPVVADRVADDLVGSRLATGPGTSTLDGSATDAFFALGDPPDWLALPGGTHLNVTVEESAADPADRIVVTYDADDASPFASSHPPLAMGEDVPTLGASVSTATRMAALDGKPVVVVVRLW